MHEDNIGKIQNETLKIIEETEKLLTRSVSLGDDKLNQKQKRVLSKENIEDHLNTLDNEIKKIKNLEFVIAVVGTMKAGKSTTINAIVGQEILPNRTMAMTSLPTLVTHKLGQKEPKLILPENKIPIFTKLFKNIKSSLLDKSHGGEFLGSKDGQDMQDLIKENNLKFIKSYTGQKEIFQFLKTLNDLMRAANDLNIEPPYEEFQDVDELPRIEVEFFHLKNKEKISESKLTILDTPGPDEFKHSAYLREVFQTQLNQASAIMLIMDYTVMNNQGDGIVREQIEEITDLIGKEHMFVLVNKFDEKGKNDPDYEEIRTHIAKNMLNSQIDKNNIFPVSAKTAYYVNQGLQEIESKGKINVELPWVEDFGEEIIGRRWEENIDDNNEIVECCKEAWKDSYFETPLNTVIVHAHAKAAVKSIDAALNKLLIINKNLNNAFKTKANALKKNIDDLKSDIKKLQQDISDMSDISVSIKKGVEENLKSIKTKMDELTKEQLSIAQKKIMGIFEKQSDIKKEKAKEKIKSEEKEGGIFKDFLSLFRDSKKKKLKKEQLEALIKEGELKFDSKSEAKDFTDDIQILLEKNIKTIFNSSERVFKAQVYDFIPSVNQDIKSKLGDLIGTIQKRMGGDIDIELPEIVFTKEGMSIKNTFKDAVQSNTITKTTWVEKGIGIARFFGDIFNMPHWGYNEVKYDTIIYTITKDKIMQKINFTFNKVSNTIQNNVQDIYTKNIKEVISESIKNLTNELEEYRGEMMLVVKKREADEINIEQEISSAKTNQDIAQKMIRRTGISKKLLNKLDGNED